MCETHHSNSKFTMRDGRCAFYGHHEIPLVKNGSEEERCKYSLQCDFAQGRDNGCLCEQNSTCADGLVRGCSLPSIQYPKGAILAPFIFFVYNLTENRNTPGPDFLLINGTVQCRDSLVHTTQTIPFMWWVDVRRITEEMICNRTNTISSSIAVDSVHQCHRSNESSDLCREWNPCMSITRINDGFANCLNQGDERKATDAEMLKSCRRVRRHRFLCAITQMTCLSVMVLGDQKKDCDNQFDELWLGTNRKVSQMNCNDRWKDECSLLRQYTGQSSTSNNRSEIPSHLTIPFRSYCDTFWNLDSRQDENFTECQRWWVCAEDQRRCGPGQCVDPRWESDREMDCTDASDEQETLDEIAKRIPREAKLILTADNVSLSFFHTCDSTGLFFCLSSTIASQQFSCINQSQLGDHQVDCAGAIDEINTLQQCSQRSMLGYNFRCPSTNTCIPYYLHCQKGFRCPNLTDDAQWCDREHERPSKCSGEKDFLCFNGQCARNGRCNLSLECKFGEDEYMCDYPSSTQQKFIPYRAGKRRWPELHNALFDYLDFQSMQISPNQVLTHRSHCQ